MMTHVNNILYMVFTGNGFYGRTTWIICNTGSFVPAACITGYEEWTKLNNSNLLYFDNKK
jgi:hypothetical protein